MWERKKVFDYVNVENYLKDLKGVKIVGEGCKI